MIDSAHKVVLHFLQTRGSIPKSLGVRWRTAGVADELPTPTGRETDILKVLWDLGPSSVRDVHAALHGAAAEPIAYNTVQTLLRIMESK